MTKFTCRVSFTAWIDGPEGDLINRRGSAYSLSSTPSQHEIQLPLIPLRVHGLE